MRAFNSLVKKGFLAKEDVKEILKHVGEKSRISKAGGGLVHHVYKIKGATRTAYLKIRGTRFSRIPQIETDPGWIKYEAKALRLYRLYFPDIFPKILLYNQWRNYLLLSDISHGTICLEQKLNSGTAKGIDFYFLGSKIRLIHQTTSRISKPIREDGDEEFRKRQMFYLLGFLNQPKLNKIIEVYKQIPTHLILGDPSPKNIYLKGNQLGICDLEHSHQGHYTFELAHLLAHLTVHNLTNPRAEKLSASLIEGYSNSQALNIQKELLSYTVVGLVLYRLASPVVPYRLPLDDSKRKMFVSIFKEMLKIKRLDLTRIFEILERRI